MQWPSLSGLKAIIAVFSFTAYSLHSAQCRVVFKPASLALKNSGMNLSNSPSLGSPLNSTPTIYLASIPLNLMARSIISLDYSKLPFLLMLAIYLTLILGLISSASFIAFMTVEIYSSIEDPSKILGVDLSSKYTQFCLA